jgi:hypothetical protein
MARCSLCAEVNSSERVHVIAAPVRILARTQFLRSTPRLDSPSHDQSPDLGEHARTTAPPLRVRPFARDDLPMPPENRVWRDDRGDLTQPATAQSVPVHGEPPPVVIAQPQALAP